MFRFARIKAIALLLTLIPSIQAHAPLKQITSLTSIHPGVSSSSHSQATDLLVPHTSKTTCPSSEHQVFVSIHGSTYNIFTPHGTTFCNTSEAIEAGLIAVYGEDYAQVLEERGLFSVIVGWAARVIFRIDDAETLETIGNVAEFIEAVYDVWTAGRALFGFVGRRDDSPDVIVSYSDPSTTVQTEIDSGLDDAHQLVSSCVSMIMADTLASGGCCFVEEVDADGNTYVAAIGLATPDTTGFNCFEEEAGPPASSAQPSFTTTFSFSSTQTTFTALSTSTSTLA